MKRQISVTEKFQWVLFAAIVLWTIFIWGNSLKPVESSRGDSLKVMEYAEPILDAVKAAPSIRHHIVRKMAHLIEFFTLGLLWAGVFRGRKLGVPLALCLTTAAVDEGIQLFVPGRGAQLIDVVRDFSGSLMAVCLVGIAAYCVRHTPHGSQSVI